MTNVFIWENSIGEIKYKEKDFMITYKRGFETIGCQCYKDCTCSEDNKIRNVELYRVSGKNRRDWIPKPYNFDTFEDAMNRINQLKQKL